VHQFKKSDKPVYRLYNKDHKRFTNYQDIDLKDSWRLMFNGLIDASAHEIIPGEKSRAAIPDTDIADM
jgi:hypothetical protein